MMSEFRNPTEDEFGSVRLQNSARDREDAAFITRLNADINQQIEIGEFWNGLRSLSDILRSDEITYDSSGNEHKLFKTRFK